MRTPRDPDTLIAAFLDDGITELPSSSYDVVRAAIDKQRQRVVFGPRRGRHVTKLVTYGSAVAAVVLIAVLGIQSLPRTGALYGQGATPVPSAIPDPSGRLQPGTYVAHPFDTLLGMDARAFTFDVPSADWEAAGDPGRTIGVAWNNDGLGESRGVGLGFLKVDSLNADACRWVGTDDDIAVGPTVDDLLEALAGSTEVDGGRDPYTEYVTNATGQGVELTMPGVLQYPDVGCDEDAYRIWNAEGFDIYAQGPSNTWRLGIFEVGGERYVVMASFMPTTPASVFDELWSIFRSVRIDPAPGCPRYAHACN